MTTTFKLTENMTVHSGSQEIPCISQNLKVHYHVHKSPPQSLPTARRIQFPPSHPSSPLPIFSMNKEYFYDPNHVCLSVMFLAGIVNLHDWGQCSFEGTQYAPLGSHSSYGDTGPAEQGSLFLLVY
jgi:hypothetical protein